MYRKRTFWYRNSLFPAPRLPPAGEREGGDFLNCKVLELDSEGEKLYNMSYKKKCDEQFV